MQLYHISVPAKPYISLYAQKRYGNPIYLSATSSLSVLIKALLANPQYRTKFNLNDRDLRFKYLTSSIQCAVPYSLLIRNEVYNLTPDHLLAINQFLEEDFKERLYFHCQVTANWQKRRAGIEKALETFAKYYNLTIDTHITLEALKKMEYRYRQNNQKYFFAEMSTQFSQSIL